MAPITLFRDTYAPRHGAEQLAYERFLLDTYADRRESPASKPAKVGLVRALRSLLSF